VIRFFIACASQRPRLFASALRLCSFTPFPGATRPFPFCPATGFRPRSRHANQGGQNEEKTMNIINIALLLNAIAQLIAAFAKFINAIRHRR
jgi:hypothetical protein